VKVSNSFVPSQPTLLDAGVYDIFKSLGNTADLVRIFNTFKDDDKLIDDIEAQLNDKENKNATEYLTSIAATFDSTDASNPQHKFKTEKKAYTQLNADEKNLLNEEQVTLESGCKAIAASRGINIQFTDEMVDDERYTRLKVVTQNPNP
jgi:hypothetical protein